MKKLIYSFLIGVVIGGSIIGGIFLIAPQSNSTQSDAQSIVDFAIDDWTAARDSSLVEAQVFERGLPGARLNYIPDTVRVLAQWVEETFHVPHGVTISQWILESRFGLSDLQANNYFGMTYPAVKKYMDDPAWIEAKEQTVVNGLLATGKKVRFAKFINVSECFETYGRYLAGSQLYKPAFEQINPEHFAREVAKHYATDPSYSTKLIVLMRRYKLN